MKPNILVFLTDDHGQWASGCYGNRELRTPSIDWLAQTGARFDQAFTPCPVCSPARASFWTGKVPSAHGIHDHIANPDHPGITGQRNLAEKLSAAGYQTGLCGKWHAHARGDTPQPGFDFWFSQWGGTNAKFGSQPFSENGERRDFHGHQAPIITDAAIRFVREAAEDQPFFLFVGFTETHSPFATLPERLVEAHRDDSFSDVAREPLVSCHGTASTPAPEDEREFREKLCQYYASVELIDEQVGRILDELEGSGQLEHTLVIYTSDHGHMNGQHGLFCKGNATTPQNFLEESIRIPLVARYPGKAVQSRVFAESVDHCDLHETLLEVAGCDLEAAGPGQSFFSLLSRDDVLTWRDFQICEYGNARMIRTDAGEKLVRRWPGPNGHFPDEFYDLREDPRETRNLIDDPARQQRIGELAQQMDRYFERHEEAANSGLLIVHDSAFNPSEPWRRDPTLGARRE